MNIHHSKELQEGHMPKLSSSYSTKVPTSTQRPRNMALRYDWHQAEDSLISFAC